MQADYESRRAESACTARVRNAGAPHGPRANALHPPVCCGASFWSRTRSAEVANWPHFATALHCVDQSETRTRHLHCTRGDVRTSSVPQVPTDSLRSLEFSSFSKISFHSKEYQSSDGARPKISGKVSGTVVDDDEGECNNTATEGESTNKDLSTKNAISNFFREGTMPAEKTICGTWKYCLLPNGLIPVPQLVVVFYCIILPP